MSHQSRFAATDFEQPESAFSVVADTYFTRGFDSGYARAIRDELSATASLAQSFLEQMPDHSPAERALVHAFARCMQGRLAALPDQSQTFSDGAGI